MNRTSTMSVCVALAAACATALPPAKAADQARAAAAKHRKKPALDHSGKPRRGKASYYGSEFYGKTMADGTPMNPKSNIAASRTLPLGTKAEVINLENGKREVVEIRDRGPYIDGRIIDLTPHTAERLDMKEQGVATVEVRPIDIPPTAGNAQSGAAWQTALGDEE